MNITNLFKFKTEEAQYTLEGAGLVMPQISNEYKERVVSLGVRSVKDSTIKTHNAQVEDLGDKVMRGVSVSLANGKVMKLDMTYDQVKEFAPEFAQRRLDTKESQGRGMIDAAIAEREYFAKR